MSRPCLFPRCPTPISQGNYCTAHGRKSSRLHRPFHSMYDHRWRTQSRAYLLAHPYCVSPAHTGKRILATVVDHITPHRGDIALFWDQAANWQPLCKSCHDGWKRAIENESASTTPNAA